jgi:hypothetical protein
MIGKLPSDVGSGQLGHAGWRGHCANGRSFCKSGHRDLLGDGGQRGQDRSGRVLGMLVVLKHLLGVLSARVAAVKISRQSTTIGSGKPATSWLRMHCEDCRSMLRISALPMEGLGDGRVGAGFAPADQSQAGRGHCSPRVVEVALMRVMWELSRAIGPCVVSPRRHLPPAQVRPRSDSSCNRSLMPAGLSTRS